MSENGPAIDALQGEGATYPPPPGMVPYAVMGSPAVYDRAAADPIGWWEDQARRLQWDTPWHTALDESNAPFYKWFIGGTLNVSANCLDRHLAKRGDQTAIIWEGDNPAESKHVTYRELHEQVCRLSNVITDLGVKKGDRVTIYLPMIVEAAVAMLACARVEIGRAHV